MINFTFFLFGKIFLKVNSFWDNGFFEFFDDLFLNWNNTFLVEDTLNLMAHFLKEIKFCIFFICDTFLIWLTVYEILIVFGKWRSKVHKPPYNSFHNKDAGELYVSFGTIACLLVHINIRKNKWKNSFMLFFLTGHAPFWFLKIPILFFFFVYIHVIYFSICILSWGFHFWGLFIFKVNGSIIIN